MRCRKAHWFLCARCDGTLSERQRLRLEAHLASCDACRREAFYFAEIGSLATRMESCSVRPDFNLRLRAAVRRADAEAAEPRKWRKRLVVLSLNPALVAASVLVLGLGGLGAWSLVRVDKSPGLSADEASSPVDSEYGLPVYPARMDQQSGSAVPLNGWDPEALRVEARYLNLDGQSYISESIGLGSSDTQTTAQEFVLPTVAPGQEPRVSY